MTGVYFALLVLWLGRVVRYVEAAVGIQKWAIPAVLICGLGEQAANCVDWWTYEYTGHSVLLLSASAVAGSLRVSLSYTVVLILSTGYGVLRRRIRDFALSISILSPSLFLFHLLSSYVRYLSYHNQVSLPVLRLSTLPLIPTHLFFYCVVFTSLRKVKQSMSLFPNSKQSLYSRMWHVLVLAAVMSGLWAGCEV